MFPMSSIQRHVLENLERPQMPTEGEEKNKSDIPLLFGFHDSPATAS